MKQKEEIKGGINFSAEDFDPKTCAKNLFEKMRTAGPIKHQIDGFDKIISQVNLNIVNLLKKEIHNEDNESSNDSLFVGLLKCISVFEREFLDFPQKISEIQKLVNDASNFPEPNFSEVPPVPKIKNEEILNVPADVIDAPLIYDSLVQQHRISESVDFFIDISQSIREKDIKIGYLLEWAERTKNSLLKEIQNRLKVIPLESESAQASFIQLVKLGFSDEGVQFYIKLATQAIEEKFNSIQNSGQLLQYVRDTSEILFSELDQKGRIFLRLFRDKQYSPILVEWMDRMIDTKLPICHPETFAGNFNLVKESINIMRTTMAPLEYLGLSCFDVFDSYPKYFLALLKSVHHQHLVEISESLKDDEWDIIMEGIRDSQPEDFPLSSSFEHFRKHLVKFLSELRDIYVPEMFYTSSTLLKELLLSYPEGCKTLLNGENPSIDKFCSILVQLVCVKDLLIPETLNDFRDIAGNDFPEENDTEEKCQEMMVEIDQMLVSTFIQMWARVLPPNQLEWEGVDEIDPQFESAVEVMTQFLMMLNLPQSLFDQTAELLIDSIISVAANTATVIENVSMLNSFEFHWMYFMLCVLQLLPETANGKLKEGLESIADGTADEQGILDDERVDPNIIQKNAMKCFQERENKTDTENEDENSSERS
ncbi:hypothetical protein M9Y10_038457 [Tritrichomonas musculus]|uniref:Exocyst component Exo84 C-terminal domain-containing protein n=1 Tax=Tritrichomonas musculus TaxID=1915356 RepID=A0ABR2KA96_9EUKA